MKTAVLALFVFCLTCTGCSVVTSEHIHSGEAWQKVGIPYYLPKTVFSAELEIKPAGAGGSFGMPSTASPMPGSGTSGMPGTDPMTAQAGMGGMPSAMPKTMEGMNAQAGVGWVAWVTLSCN
jgi:hypothetical protein